MARPIQISPEFAAERGRQLVELIDGDIIDRRPIIAKLEKIREYYYGDIKRKLRYPGQVNLHLPVIAEKVEGLVLKMMNALYGSDPVVNLARPTKDVDPDKTLRSESYLNWAVTVDIVDSYQRIQRWVRGKFLDGPSIIMPFYRHETRKGIQTSIQKKFWQAGEYDAVNNVVPVDRPKLPIEILLAQFGPSLQVLDFKQNGADLSLDQDIANFDGLIATISFVENRTNYDSIKVFFYDTKYVDEIELCVHRPIIVHDGVVLENIEFEDLIVPYRTKDLQTAERITRRYWLTIDEIEKRRQSEDWIISDEAMAGLRAQATSERQESHYEVDSLKAQRDAQVGERSSGMARTYSFEPFIDNKVLIFEVYVRDDADKDGQVEEVIYQLPAYTETIARTDYLESFFPHQHRPFPALHGIKIDDRFYTLPIAQWLLPINEEVDVTLNQTHEAQEIVNNPFFFYEPIAFGDNVSLQNGVYPGLGIPVANAKGVFFPSFPQQPLANLQAIDSLLLFADRLTMSPQAVGSSQVRNAPRTARGTLALLSEGSAKVDSFIMEAQQGGWRELMYQIHSLYQHFGPDEKWFWVTGQEKPQRITRSDMEGKFEYIFRGNSTNTNREVRRTVAIQRFQLLSPDPAYLANPVARRELILDLLRHNSEGANIDRLDPGLPQDTGGHAPMSQEVELELMIVGQDIEVLPIDDDTQHIGVLRRFMNSRPFEMLEPWQVALIATHLNKHSRQLAAKQSAGSVPGQGAATANNVAPTGGELSALEGGVG